MNNNEIIVLKNEKYEGSFSFNDNINKNENYWRGVKFFSIRNIIFISSIIVLLIIIILQFITILNLKEYKYIDFQKHQNYNNNMNEINIMNNNNQINIQNISTNTTKYDINFKYEDYDKEIINDKIKKYSRWILELNEAQFINGIIRKNQLKNSLEIGVARGGSSILILNSIKDIENSVLVSLDLNKRLIKEPNKMIGYRVNKYFPELSKKWKLYTGAQPHIFLEKLNIKFNFLLLDSAHVSPGEILNFIEALPFLNENAIVVIHDIMWHFGKKPKFKFFPSCISLMPSLYGDKIFMHKKDGGFSNIGAVFLYQNQEKHYIDYFLLLLNFWEYTPKDNQINELRLFIKKYYKDRKYISIFDIAVRENKNANIRFMRYINKSDEKKILVSKELNRNKNYMKK